MAPTSCGCARPTTPPARPRRWARSSVSSTPQPPSAPRHRWWWWTRHTSSSRPQTVIPLARAVPEPHRGAHDVQGLRPGRAAGGLRRRPAPDHRTARAAASARQHVRPCRRRSPPRRCAGRTRRSPTSGPSSPSGSGCRASWHPSACRPFRASPTSCWCASATVVEAEDLTEVLLHDGIVCRTFGPANPLRGHLRFTVRSRVENERLLAVVRSWQEAR